MTTIPASELVTVNPSVLGAGGDSLDIIGLMLTTSTRPPIGTVPSFSLASEVASYFGSSSQEASLATIYFAGFDNSNKKPSSLLVAQYNENAVGAYLRGGDISALTLAQLQAITGSLNITIDGYPRNASSVILSAATSFSNGATIIQTALNAADPTEASFTGALGASVTGSISTTTLTVTAVGHGVLTVGDTISGTGVTAGTTITALGSGTGGTGTYTVSASQTVSSTTIIAASNKLVVSAVGSGTLAVGQTVDSSGTNAVITALGTGTGGTGTYTVSGSPQHIASESMTAIGTPVTVTYDSTSGAFIVSSGITGTPSLAAFATGTIAATLLLTSATGAVLSQGAAAASPSTFMDGILEVTTDWVTFFTAFDPDASGNSVKEDFADWAGLQNDRYAYVCWDNDTTPTTQDPATSSLGYLLEQSNNSGTVLIWAADSTSGPELAAFFAGAAASIDFDQRNGRITFAYKEQSGLTADVTTQSIATYLGGSPQGSDRGNGYNFYGAYGSANLSFVWFQRGFITGAFLWADSFINQVWLTNRIQAALLSLLENSLSIPFNNAGAALISAALADVIDAGLNFGAFAPGTISASQQAAVNAAAGASVAGALQSQGWYLQVVPASSSVRAARGPQQVNLWYLDRGSVQSITVSSVAVQ